MNTIKIFLSESGRVADLHKDFPLYQHQFQNKLLNVYVPTSILAPHFDTLSDQDQTLSDYVAGTAVKIGMRYLTRSGEIKVSESRYMRYLKTLTYQNVEYALFERKLPKEFTLYAGQGQNAPVLIINVVNIETDVEPNEVLSIIPSQSCSLDVMPSSDLDNDEAIEPSELDAINARLNAIDEILPEKQDKVDDRIQLTTDSEENITWQDSHSVVGAINNNTAQNELNKNNIAENSSDISDIKSDIEYLYEHFAQPEEYIGQMEGSSLPTDEELTEFVEETAGREPKNADVVIFILQVSGGTDKNYKYTYSTDGWNGYEIPALEEADNGSLGLVQGTYNIGSANNTLVDIVGGEILNIYVKDNSNTYRNIREYLNTTTTNISNIVNGTTSVGIALRAIADELGNNIVNTYLTQSAGATKAYVKAYALPRTFNDIMYVVKVPNSSYGTYTETPPTDVSAQFIKLTNAVGDFTFCQLNMVNLLQREFELSRKNSCQNSFWISANRDCVVTFRLTTQAKLAGQEAVDLSVELSSPVSFISGTLQRIDFTSIFSYLGENVLKFQNFGDTISQKLEIITEESANTIFYLYSNETYPSTFNLNTASYVVYHTFGKLGEQPVYELTPSGEITSSGVALVGSNLAQMYNNTECLLKIAVPVSTEGYAQYFGKDCQIISITLGGESVRLATPFNFLSGQPTFGNLARVNNYTNLTATYYIMKCFIQIDSGDNITFIVDEDNFSGLTEEEIDEMCDDILYPALPAPQNVSISGTVLSFDSVDGAEEYEIYADGDTLGDFTPASSVSIGGGSTTLQPNETTSFTSTILPLNSKDWRVIWTIEGDGTITYTSDTGCTIQAGNTTGTIVLTATAFNNSSVSDSVTINVVPEPVELLDIDYSDGTIGSAYNNAHWLQEKYNNGWQTISNSMNCRADPSDQTNKVVNMVTGYYMNYRYTYTPDNTLLGATSLSVDLGNYFSGAQPLSVKISVYDENNNQIYIAGDASNYITIPVGSTLEPYTFTFSSTNVSKIQFLVKNSVNSNAYLYTDNIIVMGTGE